MNLERFFELSSEKKRSKRQLHKEVFSYYFTIQNSDPGKVLKPMREFILPTTVQLNDSENSLINYMELLDENADSQETMAEVSELVLGKLLSELHK